MTRRPVCSRYFDTMFGRCDVDHRCECDESRHEVIEAQTAAAYAQRECEELRKQLAAALEVVVLLTRGAKA